MSQWHRLPKGMQRKALRLFDDILDAYLDHPRATWPPCPSCGSVIDVTVYLCGLCGRRSCVACIESQPCGCHRRLLLACNFRDHP